MHILLLHQYFQDQNDPGGLRWNELTRIWTMHGHKVTVIAGMTHYTKGRKDQKYKRKYFHTQKHSDHIRVIRTHVSERYNLNYSGRLWAYASFVWSSLFAGIFKAREKYDVLIASSPPLTIGWPAYLISRLKRIPLIFEVRDLWPESAVETGILKNKLLISRAYKFESFMYRKSKLINVLTPAFKKVLIQSKHVDPSKLIMIPNAADFRISEELFQKFDRKRFREEQEIDDKLVVIYVGAHGLANHLEQIIEAAVIMKNEPVVFMLVGDGMQKKNLIQKADALNLTNIRFIDSVSKEESMKFIMAADIGTSVLKKTNAFKTVWSNKTFDYMSCKKPILMAIDGISRELIETANAGMYVEPENPQDFANKLKIYLNDRALITEHGNNGYAYARQHFDRNALAIDYLRAIESVVTNHMKLHKSTADVS